MSVIELSYINLGYMKRDSWGNEKWIEGCGPSGEIGISVGKIFNVSNKEINKIALYCIPLDAAKEPVGKEMRCTINSYLRGRHTDMVVFSNVFQNIDVCTDPSFDDFEDIDDDNDDSSVEKDRYPRECIHRTDRKVYERLWCAPTAQYVRITKVQITYADDSTEIINRKDIKNISDADSEYQAIYKTNRAAYDKCKTAVWEKESIEEERKIAEEERRRAEKKAEKERKKAEEERIKAEKEKSTQEDKAAKGIVAWAGVTEASKDIKITKAGNITFYLQGNLVHNVLMTPNHLVGWESTRKTECLEMPAGCRRIDEACLKGINTVVFPRETEKIVITVKFDGSDVKKIVIPKTAKEVFIPGQLSSSIEEVEFEDPYGWGMTKDTIRDPKKIRDYMVNRSPLTLTKSAFGSFVQKLL